jgi:hypothetical protein
MTDKPTDAAPAPTQPAAPTSPVTTGPATTVDETNGPITQNKSFWAGVGIGSAALVAALMYARSPKKKK